MIILSQNSHPLAMCISRTANQTLGCLFVFEHRSVSSWESYVVIFFLEPTWGVPNPLDMPRPPRTHGNTTVTQWPRGGPASLCALELGALATAQTSTYRHQTMYLWLNRYLCNYKWFLEKINSKLWGSCSSNLTHFQLNRREFVFFTRGGSKFLTPNHFVDRKSVV